MNLFEDAKAKVKKTASKKEKLNIEIKDKDFNKNLKNFVKAKQELDSWKSKLAAALGLVKEKAMEVWLSEVETAKNNPGSVNISSTEARFQFVPTDRYISIDPERAKELKEKYGDDIIEKEVVYSFNPELLTKYSKVLSNLITKSKDIDDADKARLIEKTEKLSIAKGSLDKACTKNNAEEMITDIEPVFQCKYPKLVV